MAWGIGPVRAPAAPFPTLLLAHSLVKATEVKSMWESWLKLLVLAHLENPE